jgi:hypothetical protein
MTHPYGRRSLCPSADVELARTAASYEMAPPLVLKNGNPAAKDSCSFPPDWLACAQSATPFFRKLSMLALPA